MKKLLQFSFLFVILILLISGWAAFCQESGSEREYKFTLKTNPLAALGGPFWVVVIPVTGEYKVYFETAVSGKTSFQLGGSYIGPSVLINLDEITKGEGGEISGVKTNGFRVQGTYKIFVSRDLKAPEGFYLGPNFSYAKASVTSRNNSADKVNGSKINVNGIIGYQLITSGGFTLDIFTGLGFVSRKFYVSGENFDASEFTTKNSVSVPLGIAFGYAF